MRIFAFFILPLLQFLALKFIFYDTSYAYCGDIGLFVQ